MITTIECVGPGFDSPEAAPFSQVNAPVGDLELNCSQRVVRADPGRAGRGVDLMERAALRRRGGSVRSEAAVLPSLDAVGTEQAVEPRSRA